MAQNGIIYSHDRNGEKNKAKVEQNILGDFFFSILKGNGNSQAPERTLDG